MRSSLLYLFETWLACTVFGLAALAPMRRSFRDLWLPAAPALGAAFLVVTLHTTSVFVGVRVGVFVVMVPAHEGFHDAGKKEDGSVSTGAQPDNLAAA